ncbi:phage baseplate protein [Calorimonas adulescens]|uniref:Dit-like phage tail protein N-terminal domain-containing protein n=1 Tax=Calorimonas adulescens TaxID=2606906 RepID=A0A5D8QJ58_9THEO|nr:hypothetical protein [Calorimonas adulescens]TZE83533.1 hypothetical protein FWJ32_01235 [Calorimonas adulescens]
MRATRPASINGIEFDVLINQTTTYEADIPEYPTEKGYSVEDTIILKPLLIDLTIFLTDTPVTWAKRFGKNRNRVKAVTEELKRLYFNKQPVTFTTSEGTWKNMGIVSITIPKTAETGYACEIPIKLKQIRVTEAKTVAIQASYGKSGATGANAGTISSKNATNSTNKSEQKKDSKKAASILYGLADSAKLFG